MQSTKEKYKVVILLLFKNIALWPQCTGNDQISGQVKAISDVKLKGFKQLYTKKLAIDAGNWIIVLSSSLFR